MASSKGSKGRIPTDQLSLRMIIMGTSLNVCHVLWQFCLILLEEARLELCRSAYNDPRQECGVIVKIHIAS